MKKLILVGLVLINGSAWAGTKYVCVEYNKKTERLKQTMVVLTQIGDEKIEENVPARFYFELFRGPSTLADLETEGTVTTEDVYFAFNSDDNKVHFQTYLDELEESSLTLNNKDRGTFVCR